VIHEISGLEVYSEDMKRKLIINVGKLFGILVYVVAVYQRRLVIRNLRFCYPEWNDGQIRKLARRVFQNFGITFIEVCQSAFMSRDQLSRRYRVNGEDILTNALKANKGILIITAHIGNWEVAQHYMNNFEKPFSVVATKMKQAWADRLLNHLRSRFGNTVIDKKGGLSNIMQALRRGEIVVLLIDQSRRKQGIEVTFFGREATATPAAALLAMRCKSTVLPMFCVRDPDGQLTIHVKPPLETIRTGDVRSDLQTNTQTMMNAVEEMVREYPDQWFWTLKPWKVAYPHLYWEWEERRRRRKARKKRRAASQKASSSITPG
jgi:KDO2-lipid IV(A) lauroyltransferase